MTSTHGGRRAGAGRPPLAGARQSERLNLTATEAERAEIEAAVPGGMPVGRWIIEAALLRARGHRWPDGTAPPPRLTAEDLGTLERASELRSRHDAGIFPRGPGQHRHFARLVRLGMLEFQDWGRDVDGEVERDVMVYRLTDVGSAALASQPDRPQTGGAA